MLTRIWHRVTSPRAVDEEERLREHITRVVLALTLVALMFFTGLVVLGWSIDVFKFLHVVLTVGLVLIISAALWLAINGRWELAGLLAPLAFFGIGIYGTYTYGLIANTNLLYAVAVLLAAMIRSGREQWLIFALGASTYVILGWLRDANPVAVKLDSALTVSGALLGITLLQWFFARQLRHALASSRAYAAVLKEYRNHLEDLVEQRTEELGRTNRDLQIEIGEKREVEEALLAAHDALESRVDERTAELSVMLEATRAISSTLDLNSILHVIAKQMVLALNAQTCVLYRFDEEQSHIERWATWSRETRPGTETESQILRLQDLPRVRAVLRDLEPQTLNSEEDAWLAESGLLGDDKRAGSLLLLPLAARRKIIGLVAVLSIDQRRDYSAADVRLCRALADQAAVTIENARLHAETQQRSQRLAALHNIDMAITSSLDLKFTANVLLEQLVNQMQVDAAILTLNRQQSLRFLTGRGFRSPDIERARLKIGEGLAGVAALERRLIQVADLHKNPLPDVRSEILKNEGMITGFAVPLIARGDLQGVLEIFYRRPFNPDPDWRDFVETIGGQAAIAIHNTERLDRLEGTKSELEVAFNGTLKTWVLTIYERLGETPTQIERLIDWTVSLAQSMQLHDREIVHLARGVLLHDIGMLRIPQEILQKNGPLSDSERQQIEIHPTIAFDLLSRVSYLKPCLDIPYCHHERWDGSGYPLGLKAHEIPPSARIFSVVDVWHALTSERPFRPAWPQGEARAYMLQQRGLLFDPAVVDVFDELLMRGEELDQPAHMKGYAPASERASS